MSGLTPEQEARLDRILRGPGGGPTEWDAPSADTADWIMRPDGGAGASIYDGQGHEVAHFRYIRDARTVMAALGHADDR